MLAEHSVSSEKHQMYGKSRIRLAVPNGGPVINARAEKK